MKGTVRGHVLTYGGGPPRTRKCVGCRRRLVGPGDRCPDCQALVRGQASRRKR